MVDLTVFAGGANGSGNGSGNDGNAPAVPVVYSQCRAWGDPHVITFDGANNDVYGVATYVLAQSKAALTSDVGTKVPFKMRDKICMCVTGSAEIH